MRAAPTAQLNGFTAARKTKGPHGDDKLVRMAVAVRPLTLVGMTLALVGPGIIALLSDRFADSSSALSVHAMFLGLFLLLVAAVATIAFRSEKLSWSQIGFGRITWATPLRAGALVLFFVFVFGPLASLALAKLGPQSFTWGVPSLRAFQPGIWCRLSQL